MHSDKQLIEGCSAGKRRYQNRLYSRYSRQLMAICLRFAKNRTDAEDILQEGFVKIFSKIDDYKFEGSFEGWLKRIVINTAITHYTKNKKNDVQTDIDDLEDRIAGDAPSYHETEKGHSREKALMKLIQELPEGYRMVFNLYVFEGYTHAEIAELLDVSENTSKSQLSKARKYLRKRLEELNFKR